MHYTEPYKLQLNLEISSSNMLEILKQLARLSKDSNINTSFTLPEAIPDISGEPLCKFRPTGVNISFETV